MSYAPGWLAYAGSRAEPPISGQPNNYREKMAAFGVHDESVPVVKRGADDQKTAGEAGGKKAQEEKGGSGGGMG